MSEIRVFEMLQPEEGDIEDPVMTEKSKDKKSKAAAQDELKELLARKQEEYKKLQAEKMKNKRQGSGKGKKGAGGGASDKGSDKGQAGAPRGMGNSPSQELLLQTTAANAALGKDPFGVYKYDPQPTTLRTSIIHPSLFEYYFMCYFPLLFFISYDSFSSHTLSLFSVHYYRVLHSLSTTPLPQPSAHHNSPPEPSPHASTSTNSSSRNMGKFEQVVTHISSVKGPLKVTAAGLAAKTREAVTQQENQHDINEMTSPSAIRQPSINDNMVFGAPGSTPFHSYSRQSSDRPEVTLGPSSYSRQFSDRPDSAGPPSYSRQSSDSPDVSLGSPGSTPFHSRQSSLHDNALQLSFRNNPNSPSGPPNDGSGAAPGSDWGLALARLRFLKDTRFALNEILTHEDLYLAADLLASTSTDPNITGTGGQVRRLVICPPFKRIHPFLTSNYSQTHLSSSS